MRLLISADADPKELRESVTPNPKSPRLHALYQFGAGFHKRGHQIHGINVFTPRTDSDVFLPFQCIYKKGELKHALQNVDLAIFWSKPAIWAIWNSFGLFSVKQKAPIVLASYVWSPRNAPGIKEKISSIAALISSYLSHAVVLMTSEQTQKAREMLPPHIPVIKLGVGIDTSFYKITSSESDIPLECREAVRSFMHFPYVVLSGDQLRCDGDLLSLAARIPYLRVVRVCQSAQNAKYLREQISSKKLMTRFTLFEKIDYPFLRYLFQHAAGYAGLIDSSWQPAGWSATCEAIASGLPVILYDGLVARELTHLKAGELIRIVPHRDIRLFQSELETLINTQKNYDSIQRAQEFAAKSLDIESTTDQFVTQIENLVAASRKNRF